MKETREASKMVSTKDHSRQHNVRKAGRKSTRHSGRKSNPEEELRKQKREAALMKERRVLIVTTGLSFVAFLVWIVAISTDFWILMAHVASQDAPNGTAGTSAYRTSHSGLWRICTTTGYNETIIQTETCEAHNMDSSVEELARGNVDVATVVIDYRRTVMALAVISLFVMIMAVAFSVYTFRNPRYTFKRLAGGINILTAAIVLVLIEVVSGGAAFSWIHLRLLYPRGTSWHYGYSIYLAWVTFLFFVYAGLAFLFYSRKKKGDRAPDEDMALTDGPQIMSR